jgi:hypothetical protein
MTATAGKISELLHEAGETHHQVFRIVDGADDAWASWYAWWLINMSELPDLLTTSMVSNTPRPTASHASVSHSRT